MAAKDHAHDLEALVDVQLVALQQQVRQHVDVGHAQAQHTAGGQHTVPFAQRGDERVLVVKVLQHMRRIDLGKGAVCKLGEVDGVALVVHQRAWVDVQDLPALALLFAANVQSAFCHGVPSVDVKNVVLVAGTETDDPGHDPRRAPAWRHEVRPLSPLLSRDACSALTQRAKGFPRRDENGFNALATWWVRGPDHNGLGCSCH